MKEKEAQAAGPKRWWFSPCSSQTSHPETVCKQPAVHFHDPLTVPPLSSYDAYFFSGPNSSSSSSNGLNADTIVAGFLGLVLCQSYENLDAGATAPVTPLECTELAKSIRDLAGGEMTPCVGIEAMLGELIVRGVVEGDEVERGWNANAFASGLREIGRAHV